MSDMNCDESDPLAAPRGIMWGLVFSAPLWVVIVLVVWLVYLYLHR